MMADHGIVTPIAGVVIEVSNYTPYIGTVNYGAVLPMDTFAPDVPATPATPTTGQIWPRGQGG